MYEVNEEYDFVVLFQEVASLNSILNLHAESTSFIAGFPRPLLLEFDFPLGPFYSHAQLGFRDVFWESYNFLVEIPLEHYSVHLMSSWYRLATPLICAANRSFR